jgi:hypothetical protein
VNSSAWDDPLDWFEDSDCTIPHSASPISGDDCSYGNGVSTTVTVYGTVTLGSGHCSIALAITDGGNLASGNYTAEVIVNNGGLITGGYYGEVVNNSTGYPGVDLAIIDYLVNNAGSVVTNTYANYLENYGAFSGTVTGVGYSISYNYGSLSSSTINGTNFVNSGYYGLGNVSYCVFNCYLTNNSSGNLNSTITCNGICDNYGNVYDGNFYDQAFCENGGNFSGGNFYAWAGGDNGAVIAGGTFYAPAFYNGGVTFTGGTYSPTGSLAYAPLIDSSQLVFSGLSDYLNVGFPTYAAALTLTGIPGGGDILSSGLI